MSLSSRLLWYKNRLAAMDKAEILWRVREAALKHFDAPTAKRLAARPRDYGALPDWPGLKEAISRTEIPQPLLADWENQAEEAQSGEYTLLNKTWPRSEATTAWHMDPQSQSLWPQNLFCFSIPYRQGQAAGDIKYVWELNRLQFLQPLAALAFARKDAKLATFCIDKIENWIDANPPFDGVNWNSGIELALRTLSILWVACLTGDQASRQARGKIWATLQTHGRWIARYPSRYSSGNNHRAAEALALFALGTLCPHFPEAKAWKDKGWAILQDSAHTLILPDGSGAEQSVSYAAFTLELFLTAADLAQKTALPLPDDFLRRLTQSATYLRWLTDGNGHHPQIGDDDNTCVWGAYRLNDTYTASVLSAAAAWLNRADLAPIAQPPLALRHFLFGLPFKPDFTVEGYRCFPHGGLSVGRHKTAQGEVLLAFDHGPLGFGTIAAHGHADALALWLHIDGKPVLVDAGTYLYHVDESVRGAFRGTRAHNTLTIDGMDSSRRAGNFNWSRKAQCALLDKKPDGANWSTCAEHDGYLQSHGVIHRRALQVAPSSGVTITDSLIGTGTHAVEIDFLLHPSLSARQEGGTLIIADGPQTLLTLRAQGPLTLKLEPTDLYSPAFSLRQKTTRIVLAGRLAAGQNAVTHLFWTT